LFPGFQFDACGHPFRRSLPTSSPYWRLDPWSLVLWFTGENGRLGEVLRPIER